MPATTAKGEPHEFSLPQTTFLLLHNREAFYGGAAGGGKSDALLAAGLQYVNVPNYSAIIFRKTFADLALPGAIMDRSKLWLAGTDAGWNEQQKTWTFPSGAKLAFAYLQHAGDELRYKGAEFQFVGFDELTGFHESQYRYLFSRLRRLQGSPVPIRMRAASNPGDIGHAWVKRRFITQRKPGVAFVPAKVADNPGLDIDEYVVSLHELPDETRRQLLDGDWDVFEGAAFTIGSEHVVDTFTLNDAFDRFEAADYGLNGAPWALWAVDFEGNLVAADMLYERDLIPSDLAPLVKDKRDSWGSAHRTFIDPSIWHRTGARNKWGAPAMLADEFTENGINVEPANNDPRAGLVRLRELLKPDPKHLFPSWHPRAGEPGSPRVFFVQGATDRLIEELRAAPLHPLDKRDGGEKVDPEWESAHGHACAMARYAVMTRPRPSTEPEPPLEDDRAEWLRQYEQQRDERGKGRYSLT